MAYAKKQVSSNFINKLFLNQDCVLDSAFESFAGRWTAQVLICIDLGENRFGLIKEKLSGISDHILAQRLNQLVEHNLVEKEEVYSLTDEGSDLVKILEQLAQWEVDRRGNTKLSAECQARSRTSKR